MKCWIKMESCWNKGWSLSLPKQHFQHANTIERTNPSRILLLWKLVKQVFVQCGSDVVRVIGPSVSKCWRKYEALSPNQRCGLSLPLAVTGFLMEEQWLLLHQLSDARTSPKCKCQFGTVVASVITWISYSVSTGMGDRVAIFSRVFYLSMQPSQLDQLSFVSHLGCLIE